MKSKKKTSDGQNGHANGSSNGQMTPDEKVEAMVNRFTQKREDLEVDKYFRALVKLQGSDLHMKVGKPPIIRVNGTLKPMNREPVEIGEMARLLFPMMTDRTRKIFDEEGGADFAYTVDVDGTEWRFRVNMLQQFGKDWSGSSPRKQLHPGFRGTLPPAID